MTLTCDDDYGNDYDGDDDDDGDDNTEDGDAVGGPTAAAAVGRDEDKVEDDADRAETRCSATNITT